MNTKWMKLGSLTLGIMLSAYPVIAILRPNGLMTGGITGLSRVIEAGISQQYALSPFMDKYLFSFAYYLLAILVLILAYVFLGKEEALRIILLSFIYPVALFIFTFINIPPLIFNEQVVIGNQIGTYNNLLIPATIFGVLSGIGSGLILRSGYTSGGSDTIAKVVWKRLLPFVSYGQVLLLVDGIIIFSSLAVFDLRIVFYAILLKYINMRSIDMIVLGIGNKRVKMEIISMKFNEIVPFIQNSIHRGVTLVETEGAFSHTKGRQLITICTPRESLQIKNFIASIDDQAFVYVIPSSTVWGKGFKNIRKDDL